MRTRVAPVLLIVLALLLSACGTWDPTSQAGETEEGATAPDTGVIESGEVSLVTNDKTYTFSVDECFASSGDQIELRARTEEGEQLTVDYDVDAPHDRTIQVIGQDGTIILDGSAAEGVEEPNLTIEENGFAGTATFRRTDGSMVGGEMSGAC